jgi:hypothetical protein
MRLELERSGDDGSVTVVVTDNIMAESHEMLRVGYKDAA